MWMPSSVSIVQSLLSNHPTILQSEYCWHKWWILESVDYSEISKEGTSFKHWYQKHKIWPKPKNSTTTIVSPLRGQISSIAAQNFRQNHSPVHPWNALAGLLFVKCLMQLREDSVDHRIVVLFSRRKIAGAAFHQIQNNNQVSGKCHFLCRKLFCYFSLIQSCQNKLKRELRQILTNTSHTKLDINAFPSPNN